MALTRAKKKQKVQVLARELETSTTAIIGTFAKMTVSPRAKPAQLAKDEASLLIACGLAFRVFDEPL